MWEHGKPRNSGELVEKDGRGEGCSARATDLVPSGMRRDRVSCTQEEDMDAGERQRLKDCQWLF